MMIAAMAHSHHSPALGRLTGSSVTTPNDSMPSAVEQPLDLSLNQAINLTMSTQQHSLAIKHIDDLTTFRNHSYRNQNISKHSQTNTLNEQTQRLIHNLNSSLSPTTVNSNVTNSTCPISDNLHNAQQACGHNVASSTLLPTRACTYFNNRYMSSPLPNTVAASSNYTYSGTCTPTMSISSLASSPSPPLSNHIVPQQFANTNQHHLNHMSATYPLDSNYPFDVGQLLTHHRHNNVSFNQLASSFGGFTTHQHHLNNHILPPVPELMLSAGLCSSNNNHVHPLIHGGQTHVGSMHGKHNDNNLHTYQSTGLPLWSSSSTNSSPSLISLASGNVHQRPNSQASSSSSSSSSGAKLFSSNSAANITRSRDQTTSYKSTPTKYRSDNGNNSNSNNNKDDDISTQDRPTTANNTRQYYCSSCGIRFTCLTNLKAHQTYYCSSRQTNGSGAGSLHSPPTNRRRNMYPNCCANID